MSYMGDILSLVTELRTIPPTLLLLTRNLTIVIRKTDETMGKQDLFKLIYQ